MGVGAALSFPIGMSVALKALLEPTLPAARVSTVPTLGYCSTFGHGAFSPGPPLIRLLGDRQGLPTALTAVLVAVLVAGAVCNALRTAA